MPNITLLDPQKIREADYTQCSVGCIVLSYDRKIILQQRDEGISRFPGCLGTFGGGIDNGEKPIQALMRELEEELGAKLLPGDVIFLGAITEEEAMHRELVYGYFWHDRHNIITGCYEGQMQLYDTPVAAFQHPKITADVRWLLEESQRRGLLTG